MGVIWTLPLKDGYRYKAQTICLAGLSAHRQESRTISATYLVHQNRDLSPDFQDCVGLFNREGQKIYRDIDSIDPTLERELSTQAQMLDVPYIALDYKAMCQYGMAFKQLTDAQMRWPRGKRVQFQREYIREYLRWVRTLVESCPWMRGHVKVDIIRLQVNIYTDVTMDHWFNMASFIKNLAAATYFDRIKKLMTDHQLTPYHAAIMALSWNLGIDYMGNFNASGARYSSDMMSANSQMIRTSDLVNMAKGIVFPYGRPMRGTGGYTKFGNEFNNNHPDVTRYTYHRWTPHTNPPRLEVVAGEGNMFEFFHQPVELGGQPEDLGLWGGSYNPQGNRSWQDNQVRALGNRDGLVPTSHLEIFNYWIDIFNNNRPL